MDTEAPAGTGKVQAPGGEVRSAKDQAMSFELLKEFVRTSGDKYAPWVFGVASTLILWTYVVKPEFERRNIDWESHQKIVERQQEQCQMLNSTGDTLRDTAVVLDKTSERLERMTFASDKSKDK